MKATCPNGHKNTLLDSNDDRENWEAVIQDEVVVDDEKGTIVAPVVVARRLTIKCSECEETFAIEEEANV